MKTMPRTLLLWLLFSQCMQVAAQTPTDTNYRGGMPDPARVIADIHGTNSLDSAARQLGALKLMMQIVTGNSFNAGTPQEMAIRKSYQAAYDRIYTLTERSFDTNKSAGLPTESPHAKWVFLVWHYEADASLEKELLKRYFSPDWRARYLADKEAKPAQLARAGTQKVEDPSDRAKRLVATIITTLGDLVLLVAIISLLCGKRKNLNAIEGEVGLVGAGTWFARGAGAAGGGTLRTVLEIGDQQLRNIGVSDYLGNYITPGTQVRILVNYPIVGLFTKPYIIAVEAHGNKYKEAIAHVLMIKVALYGLFTALCTAPFMVVVALFIWSPTSPEDPNPMPKNVYVAILLGLILVNILVWTGLIRYCVRNYRAHASF
jgi:hypothetical protein